MPDGLTDSEDVSPGEKPPSTPECFGVCGQETLGQSTPWPGPEGTPVARPGCVAPLSGAWRLRPALLPKAPSSSVTDRAESCVLSVVKEKEARVRWRGPPWTKSGCGPSWLSAPPRSPPPPPSPLSTGSRAPLSGGGVPRPSQLPACLKDSGGTGLRQPRSPRVRRPLLRSHSLPSVLRQRQLSGGPPSPHGNLPDYLGLGPFPCSPIASGDAGPGSLLPWPRAQPYVLIDQSVSLSPVSALRPVSSCPGAGSCDGEGKDPSSVQLPPSPLTPPQEPVYLTDLRLTRA